MRLVLLALLVLTMAGSAAAMDFTARSTGDPIQAVRYGVTCAGINFDSAFYQSGDGIYGNQMDAGVGGQLTALHFTHKGYGFAGPYDYLLSVWDFATCTMLYGPVAKVAADAAAGAVTENVDLTPLNWSVTGFFFIGLQALDCFAVGDCYPDIGFEYDSITPAPPADGCGSVVDLTDPMAPFCTQLSTTTGFVVDFLMGVDIADPVATGACCVPGALCTITTQADCTGQYMGDGTICEANTCVPVPTENTTWGAVKALYR